MFPRGFCMYISKRAWKLVLSLTILGGFGLVGVADGRGQDWPEGKSYELKGLRVTLSAPVLAGRGQPVSPFSISSRS